MTASLRRAVFFDRDGVLNEIIEKEGKPLSPSGPDEVTIPSGVPEALRGLRAAGFLLVVATNQPDVARGLAQLPQLGRR